jgi:hypothetical protein
MEKCCYTVEFLEETKRFHELDIWDHQATLELRSIARCYLGKPNLCNYLKKNMEGLIRLLNLSNQRQTVELTMSTLEVLCRIV